MTVLSAVPALANPLDRLVGGSEPCRDLPQIDNTEYARLDRAAITLEGDRLVIDASGEVKCKTSSSALIIADASARATLRAVGSLSTCAFNEVTVRLSDFGGGLGDLVRAAKDPIEAELSRAARGEVERLCRDLLD